MKVAIILTGALRTIKKTIHYFKQNLLLHKDVNVFCCIQNDTRESEDSWNDWFKEQLGSYLKTITWFSFDYYKELIGHRELLLNHMQIDISWKNYLRSSGSMIEYFQLHLAYLKITEYEHCCGFQYEYLIRGRTDSIYTKPIDFHWLYWTTEEVTDRLEKIKEELRLSKIEESKLIPYFMSTIISDDVIPNIQHINAGYYPSATDSTEILHDPVKLNEYIKEGRYILTFRTNHLYIIRRNLFHLIPSLGMMYGQFKSPYSDTWWFNAEGQFTSICYHAYLNTHNYNTAFEDRSVEAVGWNEANFFDCDFNCINPRMLYCMVRK